MEKMGGACLYKSATGDPPFLDSYSYPFNYQSILRKDHFMGTAKIV